MLPSNGTKNKAFRPTLHGLQSELAERHQMSRKHVCQLVNGRVEATTPRAKAVVKDYQRALRQLARDVA